MPDKSHDNQPTAGAAKSSRAITIASLKAKLAQARATLDAREAAIEASGHRLVAVTAAHAVTDRIVGKVITEAQRTGHSPGLPYTAESLATAAHARERESLRAARLLDDARAEVAAARARCDELEQTLAALEEREAAERRGRAAHQANRRRRR